MAYSGQVRQIWASDKPTGQADLYSNMPSKQGYDVENIKP